MYILLICGAATNRLLLQHGTRKTPHAYALLRPYPLRGWPSQTTFKIIVNYEQVSPRVVLYILVSKRLVKSTIMRDCPRRLDLYYSHYPACFGGYSGGDVHHLYWLFQPAIVGTDHVIHELWSLYARILVLRKGSGQGHENGGSR